MKSIRKQLCILLALACMLQQFCVVAGAENFDSSDSDLNQNINLDSEAGLQYSSEFQLSDGYGLEAATGERMFMTPEEEAQEELIVKERIAELVGIEEATVEYFDSMESMSIFSAKSSVDMSNIFSGGDGSALDPYIITTPTQMSYISSDLSASYSLDNDIDMSGIVWTPIGSSGSPFTGHFNGNEHTISNLSISLVSNLVGLFGITDAATIENINLYMADITGVDYVGGFVGLGRASTLNNLILDRCYIEGESQVGGVAGSCIDSQVLYCSNNGTVNTNNSFNGGIVGLMSDGTLSDCVFKGTVTGISYIGGISGIIYGHAYYCTNTGTVSGNSSIGGIAGAVGYYGVVRRVYYCYNSGSVSGETEIAGIAGYVNSNTSGTAYLYFNANSGKITASGLYAGGIVGDSACHLYISSSYNTGEIDGRNTYGGIIGRFNTTTAYDGVLNKCYNAGIVSSTYTRAGSLIGYSRAWLVNNAYFLDGYAPAIGYNLTYSTCVTTRASASTIQGLYNTFGSPFAADDEGINHGYPIINGINYCYTYPITPIVVIPGIAGSELKDADNNEILWLSLLTGTIIRMALDINGDSINNVVPTVTGYGTSNTYENLLEELRNVYGEDNVYFFTYDWRLDNGLSAEKLSDFINAIGAPKVDIIAHSMGGLVASRYIADGNAEKVQKLITLGTPYLGSSKVPYVFASGELIVLGDVLPVASEGLRRIASHMTSAYQLLPYKNAEPYIAVELPGGMGEFQYVEDDFDFIQYNLPMIETDGESTPSSVRSFFLNKATTFMESIYPDDITAIQSVDNYVIIGTGKPTIRTSIFDSSEAYVTDLIFSSDGDGTVPCWSANINNSVVTIPFNYDHMALAQQDEVITQIIDIIEDRTPENYGNSTENGDYIVIRIACQADVTITFEDETLTNIDGSVNAETSFGSMYLVGENEDVIILALSAANVYDVELHAFNSDTMDYDIRFYDSSDDLIEERSFLNIPVTERTCITSNTEQNEMTLLAIDSDGNGNFDQEVLPDELNR